MDPTQCYRDLLAALGEGNRSMARARALKEWLDRGGFWPHNYDPAEVRANLNQLLSRRPARSNR
jgi:hypothetical protein